MNCFKEKTEKARRMRNDCTAVLPVSERSEDYFFFYLFSNLSESEIYFFYSKLDCENQFKWIYYPS